MAFEAGFSKRVEKQRHGESPEITQKKGLKELLNNPEQNKLFNLFLESENFGLIGNHEAWERYLKGEPLQDDVVIVQEQFEAFNSRKARFEQAHATLKNFSNDMLRNSPVFEKFRAFNGDQTLDFVLQHGLLDLALANLSEFEAVEAEVGKLSILKQKEQAYEKRIKEFADKHGIDGTENEERMLEILQLSTEEARREAIRAELRKKMSGIGRLFDSLPGLLGGGGTRKEAQTISIEDLPKDISERRAAYSAAGSFFTSLLETNKEFRHALARSNTEKFPIFPNGAEAKMTLADARAEAKIFEKEKALEQAKAFRELHKDDDWDDPVIRDALQTEFFAERERDAAKFKKKSFFASIMWGLANALFDIKKDPDVKKVLDKKK